MPLIKTALLVLMVLFLPMTAAARSVVTLQDAVKEAVTGNPEVQARWHALLSSQAEQDVARGSYFPRVDLSTGAGRENLTPANSSSTNLTRRNGALSLSQMLYDGFATRDEVARLAYTKLVRYYELLDASESTALEATRAYLDVLRYRELSALAQENFAQHEQVFRQIQQRVQAGVGRRVDLEQAGGRLALAQSNMLTEASNLHDVSARYLRIVGELPPADMAAPATFDRGIPPGVEDALKQAYQASPLFNAAIENVRAAQAEARGRNANFHPRVDLRASKDVSFNAEGITGRRDDQIVELVLNYNLFRGGSDRALLRQYAERLEQSKSQRDKVCRDLRQTLSIAYNDIQNLTRQLGFLDQHQLSIAKAREAYRKQFDIGQRTLLDLLDTENEYFQARRAHVNATYEEAIARARTLSSMGRLLPTLEVGRDGMPTPEELGQDRHQVDPDSQCPAQAPRVEVNVDVAAAPLPAAALPQAVPEPPLPGAPPPETVQQALAAWAAAWSSRDFPRYRGYYAKTFVPEGGRPLEQWASERAARLAKPGDITIGISELKVEAADADRAVTLFTQTYTSASYSDTVGKRLEWVREDGRWKIQREQVVRTAKPSVPSLMTKGTPGKKRVRKAEQACVCS